MYHPIRLGLPTEYPKGVSTTAVFIFDSAGNQLTQWIQTPTMSNYYGSAGRVSVEAVMDRLRLLQAEAPRSPQPWGESSKHRPAAEDIKQHPAFIGFEFINRRFEYVRHVVVPWLNGRPEPGMKLLAAGLMWCDRLLAQLPGWPRS
jgi:hypothetical protein